MQGDQQVIQRIKELSVTEKKSLEQMTLKLSEEVGEVSQALLSYTQASGCEYKDLGVENVKEECIDVIIVALSLYYKLSPNDTELYNIMNTKVNKWERNTTSGVRLEV